MSKDLDYEFNNFANLLHKDCMNLMECLKKQDKDNKPILYLGKHYEKVILPYEEYQKMCNRLESIDNAEPSEALECLKQFINEMTRCLENPKEYVKGYEKQIFWKYKNTLETTIKQALLQADMDKKELEEYKKIFKALFKEIVFEEKGHTTHKNWVRNNEYADWYAIKLTNEYGFQINNIHLTKDERDVFIKKMKEALE